MPPKFVVITFFIIMFAKVKIRKEFRKQIAYIFIGWPDPDLDPI